MFHPRRNSFPRSAIATLVKAQNLSKKFNDGELLALSSGKPQLGTLSEMQYSMRYQYGNDDWKLKGHWDFSKD